MSNRESQSGVGSTAERVFAEYLARVEMGEDGELDQVCERHPELAEEIRALNEDWQRLQAVLPHLLQGSPAASILERFGMEVDPGVSLEQEDPADSLFKSEVLGELAAHQSAKSRYRKKNEVARGGMGAILRVWDSDLRRNLAMKVLLGPHSTGEAAATELEPRQVSRFLEEAQVTGQLDHPGIVPVHELGLDADGRIYFTMKLVRGRDLREITLLARKGEEGWSQPRVLEVILRVCDALSYAHAKGVIHRDVKPANIMVGKFGEVYLMDWGLARVEGREDPRDLRLEKTNFITLSEIRTVRKEAKESGGTSESSPLITMDGTVVGTPFFMSPEQAEGRLDAIGPQADVYGVGTLLYQLLAGKIPYHKAGANYSPHTVLAMVLQGPPTPVAKLAPEAPPELVAICEKAMARECDARYASAAELSDDLRSYLEGRVVHAFEQGTAAELRKWVGRNRALATTVIAAVLLLLVGSITWSVVLSRKNDDLALAAEEALQLEGEARNQRAEALHQRDEVLRLSDGNRLDALLRAAEDELWPSAPRLVDDHEAWLAEAAELGERLPVHVAALEGIRALALPYSPADRVLDRSAEERNRAQRLLLLEEHESRLADFRNSFLPEELLDPSWDPLAPMNHFQHRQLHAAEREQLAGGEFEPPRLSWRFEDPQTAWQHELLSELVDGIRGLSEPFGGLVAEMEARLAFARNVEDASLSGAEARHAWDVAIGSIADPEECPQYGGLVLRPQLGLLPIGRDERSGMWEFAHLASGTVPQRVDEGRLDRDESSCIVLVLLPGAAFSQGAQRSDPFGPNYDPEATPSEGPVETVVLDPFFLSKYEVTQHQWTRLMRANPSNHYVLGMLQIFNHDMKNSPVESVSWYDAQRAAARWGLALPTESQWEYACRAGTQGAWYVGQDPYELFEYENLADEGSVQFFENDQGDFGFRENAMPYDDESPLHTNVGVYLPNPFGIHDMLGNVTEWCRDAVSGRAHAYTGIPAPIDAERVHGVAPLRVLRGGNYHDSNEVTARAGTRQFANPEFFAGTVGFRTSRPLDR